MGDDSSQLVRVINTVCAEGMMATRRFEPTPAWSHALEHPDCPCHLLLVVEQARHVVGWCRAFEEGNEGVNIGIGLLTEYRDKGIGTSVLRNALEWAKWQGFSYAGLETRPENARALHVFRKVGFIPMGLASDGQVRMQLELDKERIR
jgi:ribosomal protein S18 acetylase RimI-like enzyme